MTREERKEIAQAHYKDVLTRFSAETATSINNANIYDIANATRKIPSNQVTQSVELVALDSVSCAFDKPCEGKTAILNFASYKNPGGKYIEGSIAQEEGLCHESNLYPVLLYFNNSYYAYNKTHLNRALYEHRALYTPDIVFEHDNKSKKIDVLTCAAPNYRAAHKYQDITLVENERIFRERINFMYTVAELNNVDILIAGAWGCGVFGQHPGRTCSMLMEELSRDRFQIKKVYFAIPNQYGTQPNFILFERTMNAYPRKVI